MKVGYVNNTEIRVRDGWLPVSEVSTETELLTLVVTGKAIIKYDYPQTVVRKPCTCLILSFRSKQLCFDIPSRHPAVTVSHRTGRPCFTQAGLLMDDDYYIGSALDLKEFLPTSQQVRGSQIKLIQSTALLTALVTKKAAYLVRNNGTPYWCGAVQNMRDVK